MSDRRQSKILAGLFVSALALGSLGDTCSGVQPDAANAPCSPNVAEIAIWDGQIQQLCGCGGTSGAFAPKGTPLACTFSAGATGKTVFVYYQGPFLQHQIIAVGTPAIPNGPVFDPNASDPIASTAFTLTTPGAYQFADTYDSSITGTITVTP